MITAKSALLIDNDPTPDLLLINPFVDPMAISAVSGRTGRRLWKTDVNALGHKPILVDCNGDQYRDLLAYRPANGRSCFDVVAINGRDGTDLWRQPVNDSATWTPSNAEIIDRQNGSGHSLVVFG